jgi:DNA-binding transcriptional regulator YhcF (GntR family)
MPPTITIDLNSHVPVYRQIVDAMRHLLVDGELQPGDQVPTVRQLAIDLGVHFNTVAQAYRLLADEGWLDLKRHRGAIVLDRRKPTAPSKERQKQALQKLRELTAQLQSEGIPVDQIASQLRKLADTLVKGE